MNPIKMICTLALVLVLHVCLQFEAKADAVVAEAASATVYFEPTQADADCCWKEIKAQQALYVAAKNAGEYDAAVANALFYWTRAWLHFNEAMNVRTAGWNDTTQLETALVLMGKASEDVAKQSGGSKRLGNDMIERNVEAIKDRIAKLNKGK